MINTKIVATLGPASETETMLRKMIARGMDVVRLNFSHGKLEDHLKKIALIRKLNKKMKRHVLIMQDLEGYRIRVGKLASPVLLKNRAPLFLTQEKVLGNAREIYFDYEGDIKRLKSGMRVYIDDGKIVLEITKIFPGKVDTVVIRGATLKEHKGINIPEAKLEFEPITQKDKLDLEVAVNYNLDYIAQSFVNSADDIKLLAKLVKGRHPACKIFAKIESRDGMRNLESIINASDGILVARGDLGICMPIYKVPVLQKEIVKLCRAKNKPVIVATQMLDSMTEEILPTRAEVSDVANAILDGATHVMLSGETAVGKHPDMVVDMMNKIIKNTEEYQDKLKSILL